MKTFIDNVQDAILNVRKENSMIAEWYDDIYDLDDFEEFEMPNPPGKYLDSITLGIHIGKMYRTGIIKHNNEWK